MDGRGKLPSPCTRPLRKAEGGAAARRTSPPPPDGAFPSPNGRGELPLPILASAVLHAPLRVGEGQPRGARRGEAAPYYALGALTVELCKGLTSEEGNQGGTTRIIPIRSSPFPFVKRRLEGEVLLENISNLE